MSWFSAPLADVGRVVVSTAVAYLAVVAATRVGGLRSFAKMSSFDFAATVAVGSMLASMSLSTTRPLAVGIAGLATLYGLQLTVAGLRRHGLVRRVVDNAPLLLMADGKVLNDNLRTGRVTRDELRSKLREANVLRSDEVRAVVLESTGDISVLHGPPDGRGLDPDLLRGVRGSERIGGNR